MGKPDMVRVDYRMVYGRIVAKWTKLRPADRLIPADDSLMDDPFMGDTYHMAVSDCEVDIVKLGDVQIAVDRKNDIVLLISKDAASAHTVYKNGLQLSELNVGVVQNSAQRKAVVQGAALTAEGYEKLSKMKAEGVNVFLQPIPGNGPVSLGSIEKKLK